MAEIIKFHKLSQLQLTINSQDIKDNAMETLKMNTKIIILSE